jgi:isopenicillin N synthase-like dioxygenase
MGSIPVVDVAPLFDMERKDWQVPDRALAAAARDTGFVCIAGLPGEAAPGPAERAPYSG